MSKLFKAISVGALSTVIGTQIAVAQDSMFTRDRIEGAGERYLPEFEPRDIRLGTFKFKPELGIGVESNSNIYAIKNNEEEDFIVAIAPAFNLNSDWGRHALSAAVEARHKEYIDNDDESQTDVSGFLRGRIDASRDLNFSLDAGVQNLTEQRGIYGSNTGQSEPAEFDVKNFGAAANYVRDNIQLTLGGNLRQSTFDDVVLGPNLVDDRSYRDYEETEVKGRAAYAINPDIAVFVEALTFERSYDEAPNLLDTNLNNNILRDSTGLRATVGTNFQLSQLLRGEVAVGYLRDERDSPVFEDIDGLAANVDVQWLPTPLTTFSVGVDRYTADTGQIDVPSALVTRGEFRVDHELKRNLILSASANNGVETLEGIGINYDQNFFDIGAGAVYKMNPNVHADLNLRFYRRDSNSDTRGFEFDQTVIGVGLKLFP